jgi:hypothetical protein
MVDSRFRRRTLQRASLAIQTPRQTPTPDCSSPPARSPGATPTPRHLRSGSPQARQLRVVPMVPGRRAGPPRKLRRVGRHNAGRASPDPPRQSGDHGAPGARVPMRVASRSDHPARKTGRGAVTTLTRGARQASTPDPREPFTPPPGPERILSDQHSRDQQAPCPGGRRRNDNDLRPLPPAAPRSET